jgi:hypothetical protein
MGIGDTVHGLRKALGWWKDEALQKKYEALGIITRDVMHERFREIEDLMEKFKPGGLTGQAKEFFDVVRKKGTAYFKHVDDFNRIVAYEATVAHVTPWAEKFAAGKIDWGTFLVKSKLDTMDTAGGPFIDVVKKQMLSGNVKTAVHEMGREFMRTSQFIYSRGNNPYFMQSTMGRFLGQYGTWPLQFTEYMRNMLLRGSYENRVKAFSRYLAVNAGMVYGAGAVFGVDMARWSFFSPMAFTGGPFMEMAGQAGAQANVTFSGSEDPVDVIQAARLKQNLVTQTIPLPWSATRHTLAALEEAWNQNYASAARTFLGFPEKK